ncbi:MAG: hypothetical protein HZB50_11200 [Chloroflexi bacterium]|nr:hypothetical protein [Chloroflexota bacterium]
MSYSHSSPARIFILGNGSLLDEGVTNILSLHPQLSVTNFSYTNDNTLYDLVNLERPNTIFINESNALDIGHIIGLIFSVPSASVRCVIVVHSENSMLDVYYRPATRLPVTMYRRKSVMVDTKEEFINLALDVSC